jgi:hypothetical protein
MAQSEIDGSMTDARLNREIDALMNVQPSPEFLARVRTRIDSEPVRSTWFGARLLACAAVAACLVATIVTWANWPQRRQATGASLPPATPTVASAPIEPQSKPSEIVMSPSRSGSVGVLVSPAEAAGLRYLVSALRDGRLNPDMLPDTSEELGPPTPLVIEPITVEPLVAAADVESGVLQ